MALKTAQVETGDWQWESEGEAAASPASGALPARQGGPVPPTLRAGMMKAVDQTP